MSYKNCRLGQQMESYSLRFTQANDRESNAQIHEAQHSRTSLDEELVQLIYLLLVKSYHKAMEIQILH